MPHAGKLLAWLHGHTYALGATVTAIVITSPSLTVRASPRTCPGQKASPVVRPTGMSHAEPARAVMLEARIGRRLAGRAGGTGGCTHRPRSGQGIDLAAECDG